MTEKKEYRLAEKVLSGYVKNVREAQKLMMEVSRLRDVGDIHAQSYEVNHGSGGVSDPVASYVYRLMSVEHKLARLLRRIAVVDMLRGDLLAGNVITNTSPKNLLLVLDMYYISGFTVSEVVRFLRWSRSIFYVRRNELVSLTGEYLRG